MTTVEINHVVKSFADKVVVDDLSFSVAQGEIFGLIGPNGAGKTTTIRMMMDIIKPDSGEVMIFGEKLSGTITDKLGYMPEERGLYKKLRVLDSIAYLASLKRMDRHAAIERAEELLDRTGMLPHKGKRIEEMSKGMGQIIQFIVTIVHDPNLVVLDEPFSGLDPVNTELLKDMCLDLRDQGKAVILSTHQMNQVEALCDRILMVNHGRAVLYGELKEIKSRYQDNSIILDYKGEMGEVPGVAEKRTHRGYVELILDGKTTSQDVLAYLVNNDITISRFEIASPPLNDIFLRMVNESHE